MLSNEQLTDSSKMMSVEAQAARQDRGTGPCRICRYRSKGFVLTGVLWWDYLGPQDNAHLVAYQVGLIRCDTLV